MSRKGALAAALDSARKAGYEHVLEESLVILRHDIEALGLQSDSMENAQVVGVARASMGRAMKIYEEFLERMNRTTWEE